MNARDILALRVGPDLDEAALKTAVSGLAAELARSLGQEANARGFWFDCDDRTACVTCQLAMTSAEPPFAISWEAVVVLEAVVHGPPSAGATLFVFSGGDRLGRFVHRGSDTLDMMWNEAGWSAPTWLADEYGEWENITRPRNIDPSASELIGQRLGNGESAPGAGAPQGPFGTAWTLSPAPDAGDRGRIVLSLLGERVGRLVDDGKSYIAVVRSPGGEWVIEGWRAEDDGRPERP